MAAKKRASRLGRGLSSLMAKPVDVKPPVDPTEEKTSEIQNDDVALAVEVKQGGVEEDGGEKVSRGAQELPTQEVKSVAAKEEKTKQGGDVAEKVAESAPVVEVGVVKMVSANEIIEAEGAAENIAAGKGEKVVEAVKEEVVRKLVEVASDDEEPVGPQQNVGEKGGDMGLRYLAVSEIVPNRYQPRQEFDERALGALSESIKKDGLMQPIIVRAMEEADEEGHRFELVAGERRWRAAQLAGLDVMPGFVRELDDEQLAEWALVENLQREDLNPIERAEAFKRLAEVFSLSHSDVAERVGVERATVTNHLRLLKLCDDVRAMLRRGDLSMGQARALAGIEDEGIQLAMAKKAVAEAWSVRRMEMEVRKLARGQGGDGDAKEKEAGDDEAKVRKAAQMADLEKHLAEQLSTKIKIRPGRKKGSGTLSIEFYSLDQFDDLIGRMGVKFE
ncbi:putative chromosome-partitioning protein ParB [Poriferisphaera corsica]|uniref:Putative chromosome-partitioning protein ParB n=1 Tax=Poriferisphaera corsica TaxID=2528020 RepID=A0A517YZA7_9BACT|nr:ParB/RepB/Spo0J family partition protein [Poriferisphaera corsica]QDU35544.1 putative chromosome-partitioning protein ParB [Poriferisphaera corsica]